MSSKKKGNTREENELKEANSEDWMEAKRMKKKWITSWKKQKRNCGLRSPFLDSTK